MSNILINFAIGSYDNPTAMPPDRAKIIGISRHRLSTDGDGVTTLVAFIRCTVLFCIAITLFAGCTYRSDATTDNRVQPITVKNGETIVWNDSIVQHNNGDSDNSNEMLIDSIEAVYPKVWVWDYDSLRENSSHINTIYPVVPDSLIYLRGYYESGKILSEGWCLQDWNRETFGSDYIGIWKYYTEDGSTIEKQYPMHYETER